MYVSMNNPLYDPEQLEYRGPLLDPDYDDIPDNELFVAVTANGVRYEVYGQEEKQELIEWAADNEEILTFTN